MSRSCPGKLAAGAALLLSTLVLLGGPGLAHASIEPPSSKAGVVFGVGAADTQSENQTTRAAPPENDDRDRRVLAALAFTVIGTIGLITIGSVVLLTQPGDRQVMVMAEPADLSEEPRSTVPTRRAARDGKKPATERHVRQ